MTRKNIVTSASESKDGSEELDSCSTLRIFFIIFIIGTSGSESDDDASGCMAGFGIDFEIVFGTVALRSYSCMECQPQNIQNVARPNFHTSFTRTFAAIVDGICGSCIKVGALEVSRGAAFAIAGFCVYFERNKPR